MSVPLPQHAAALLLKAVACLLAVPDGPGQRELSTHSVLAYSSKRPAAQLLCFDVVRFEPQLLQFRVVVRRELVALEDFIKLSEVSSVEGDHGLGFEHALVFVEVFAGRQGPEKAAKALDVAALLQHFAHACHLLLRKAESRKHRHGSSLTNASSELSIRTTNLKQKALEVHERYNFKTSTNIDKILLRMKWAGYFRSTQARGT